MNFYFVKLIFSFDHMSVNEEIVESRKFHLPILEYTEQSELYCVANTRKKNKFSLKTRQGKYQKNSIQDKIFLNLCLSNLFMKSGFIKCWIPKII